MLVAAAIFQARATFVMRGLAVLAGFLQTNLQRTTIQVALFFLLFTASGLAPMLGIIFVGDLLDQKLIMV
ncbi:MAG: hypothetical protein HHJ09_08050 [Glaciimonas sp.]|nr:hypothetical protein [Glaciimonas sp.]